MGTLFIVVVLAAGLWWRAHYLRRREDALRARLAHSMQRLEMLRATESELTQMFDMSGVTAWDVDAAADTVDRDLLGPGAADANRAPCDVPILAHATEHTLDAVHPEDRARFQAAQLALLSGATSAEIEFRTAPAGEPVRYWFSAARKRCTTEGQARALSGITFEVTARREAEAPLEAHRLRMERVVRGSTDGLFDIDLVSGRVWGEHPYITQRLGYQKLLSRHKSVESLVHADDLKQMYRALEEHVRGETPMFECDYRVCAADGEWVWFNANGSVELDTNRRPIRLSGVTREVTEKKEYQRQLIEATAKAAAANRSKGEFLSNMSHEIRTPMNGVIGMTGLLLDTALTSMQRDYAESIRDSGKALLNIINDILDFSKIEAGTLDLELSDIDLRDTFEDVARLLALQTHAEKLEVTLHIDPALPSLVRGDPGRLRQILLNLGSNAIKFTQRGEVSIQLRLIELNSSSALVRCEVRDTGVGIPADRLDALFQPFTQGDNSTWRSYGGTGLGLSIVRRLAELMGGTTGVESTVGLGSCFWFTARFDVAEVNTLLQPIIPTATRGRRALVVDDNATSRAALVEQLTKYGLDADCVPHADAALDALRTTVRMGRPFDVVLIDQYMPDCDGPELAHRIAADQGIHTKNLIALTPSLQQTDPSFLVERGFVGFLSKPVTRCGLYDCLMLVFAEHSEEWSLQTQPIAGNTHFTGRNLFRILVAEDNVVNQKVVVRLLERLGCYADVVPNGAAAVTAWADGQYDLILMDYQMPEMDGLEATREIRRREAASADEQHIPIIAVTAHAMKGADDECFAAGMDAYIAKPLDRTQLETALTRYLRELPDRPTPLAAET